ncbi:MAG TPA: ABC transporter substrate-binding protein [Candidatus Binatia bacterium]|nr:ABC transporter substrate-binding protein [Candidatus Binatia bacterium]
MRLKSLWLEVMERCDPKLLPPATGEGWDRGARRITPSLFLPRQGEGDLSGERYRRNLRETFILTLGIAIFIFTSFVELSAQDRKLDSFTISYASVSGTRGPLWIAKDLGLFEKYGLDGNLVYIASGVTSVNALLGGSVDIIAASGSSAIGAAARGAPIVIIASLGHIAYKLIAHPSITTVQGLKGKIIGSSRIGAGTDFALQRLLPKLGLHPGKDVTLLPTGVSESDRRLLMLVQGKIDATLGTEDNLLQLAARGMKFSVLADVYEAGVYTTGSDIATSRQLVKQKPRQLKAFIMALTEGTYIGRTQKEQALRVFRKYLKIEDPKMLDSMHKNYLLGSIPERPFPKEEAIQNDIEDLSQTYAHLKGRKAGEFLDLSLLKALDEEGFFKKLYGK